MNADNLQTGGADFAAVQGRYLMQCWAVQRDYAPVGVARTEGCWIHTTDGRRIFDLRSAHESINLGFRHPQVLAAMREQMERVVYVTDDFATAPTAELARTLAEITPGGPDKRVWFGQSGAGAVEAAIKAARFHKYRKMIAAGDENLAPGMHYPYPYKVISRYRSWHGATTGALSVGGDPRRWFSEPMTMPGVLHAPDAYCYRCPFGKTYPACDLDCARYIDEMIELEGGGGKVAAVIVEPVVGSNGIIPPPPGYFPRLRTICDRWDVVLIVDETMSGMGRTGRMLAIEHYDIVPDMVVLGKALGMYCPLSAAVFSEEIARTFDDCLFAHGQSFSGHALACAAALAGLKVIAEERVLDHVAEVGEYLGARLRQLQDRHPCVGDVRGLGLFWTLELVRDRATREPFRRHTEKYARTVVSEIAEFLLQRKNIYIPADKFGLWVVPPLIVTKSEIDFLVDAIDESLVIADRAVTWRRRPPSRR